MAFSLEFSKSLFVFLHSLIVSKLRSGGSSRERWAILLFSPFPSTTLIFEAVTSIYYIIGTYPAYLVAKLTGT